MARTKKPKPPLVYNTSSFKSFIINTLRRASYRWKPKSEALKEARRGEKGTPIFQCEECKRWIYTGNKELKDLTIVIPEGIELLEGKINIHHKIPCIAYTGWTNYDDYIRRMFCPKEDLACVCSECHDIITFLEKELRKDYRNTDEED